MSNYILLNSMDGFYKSLLLNISPLVYVILMDLVLSVCYCATPAEINRHLELGRELLAKGQLSDALTHYHEAVEGDPNNYLTYFKRGTVYLALGKAKNALSDLDRVLEMKPDFTAARLSRGSVHLKQASFDLAQLDLRNVLAVDPYNGEAAELLGRIAPARDSLALAHELLQRDEHGQALAYLTYVLESCPWAAQVRLLRADCHEQVGDLAAAASDLRSATKLQADDTSGLLRLARLLYRRGQASEALREVRECLRLDPEHRDCFALHKRVRRVERLLATADAALASGDHDACIEAAQAAARAEPDEPLVAFAAQATLCTCCVRAERPGQAVAACGAALAVTPDPGVLCDRADAYLLSEMYEDAARDFRAALELDEGSTRAKDGLQKAQRLQHQAERRDYYKILGVKRSATKRDIVKAYRKMAQKWHPDNFQGDEKKLAEKKFIDIAAAKEVLTDEDKRRQFDNGEDPLDPEQQGGRGGGGAHHFHHFQYGSPFQFKFHFN